MSKGTPSDKLPVTKNTHDRLIDSKGSGKGGGGKGK